jgi:hypothetical protein
LALLPWILTHWHCIFGPHHEAGNYNIPAATRTFLFLATFEFSPLAQPYTRVAFVAESVFIRLCGLSCGRTRSELLSSTLSSALSLPELDYGLVSRAVVRLSHIVELVSKVVQTTDALRESFLHSTKQGTTNKQNLDGKQTPNAESPLDPTASSAGKSGGDGRPVAADSPMSPRTLRNHRGGESLGAGMFDSDEEGNLSSDRSLGVVSPLPGDGSDRSNVQTPVGSIPTIAGDASQTDTQEGASKQRPIPDEDSNGGKDSPDINDVEQKDSKHNKDRGNSTGQKDRDSYMGNSRDRTDDTTDKVPMWRKLMRRAMPGKKKNNHPR